MIVSLCLSVCFLHMGCGASKARVPPEQEPNWRKLRGHELEAALKSGAIALLDGRWLVACAERGERIRRRQDLPPEAFISLGELKAACNGFSLPIICLSYAWLHPDHPVSPTRLAPTLTTCSLDCDPPSEAPCIQRHVPTL